MGYVYYNDTTLRDGEQAAGVVFSPEEKRRIVHLLSKSGIDQIEVGTPAMGKDEQEVIRSIVEMDLTVPLSTWNRALIHDIDATLSTGVKIAHISIPTSDIQIQTKFGFPREKVFTMAQKVIDYAQRHGLQVSIGLEDASRTDTEFIVFLIQNLYKYGIRRFRYADTVSILEPQTTINRMNLITKQIPTEVELEIHCHNDFGLATANTLAALSSGVKWASTTIIGLGERAGNAAMEEVVMGSRHLYHGIDNIKATNFPVLADFVSKASSRSLSESKPVVGSLVFSHESGIHVDGLLKNPMTYQSFDPINVGREHQFITGKHSGNKAIRYLLESEGILLNEKKQQELLYGVRKMANNKKRALTSGEIREIIEQLIYL
ncbi:homocysteine methyltransferase [Tepidibacillus marianensis]|uniref:homocitrate synthase/isopropylmalate synthase family protein n=1 Tax=Tepidibacillus marianensis TaxID=3131995 RepID=UPI0030CCE7AB